MADASITLTMPRCNTCRFWAFDLSDFDNVAQCRRNPPSLPVDEPVRGTRGRSLISNFWQGQPTATWPVTRQADWCGKHEARG